MSKWGWLVVICLGGWFLYDSHIESKKTIIVKGLEINSGRIVEASWKGLKSAVSEGADVHMNLNYHGDDWRDVVVLEAFEGTNGSIALRSDWPLNRAMYIFRKKDVSYVLTRK